MNCARLVVSALISCGAVAAQSISPFPLFDVPLFLVDTASADSPDQNVKHQTEAPAAPVDSAQSAPAPSPDQKVDKRAFGVLPNYRTANGSSPFQPITTKQKFTIAVKDSFDTPVFFTTAFFAGLSQVTGADNNIYGQGVKGFAHRYGISYLDQVTGNFFPEAIAPTLFHMDPRYFRKGEGTVPGRLWYAVSRIFVSRNDHGHTTFNSPEIVGNAMASAFALSYHVHDRKLGDFAYQWGFTYVTADMIGQVLKEFWPDVKRKLQKHHSDTP